MTAELQPLPALVIEPIVRAALAEDLGPSGDITSESVIPKGTKARMVIRARAAGRIAGVELARMAFLLVEPPLKVSLETMDGHDARAGDTLLRVAGEARAILAAERVALNFLAHLSGVATATKALVDAVAGTRAKICCTRKTTPGLRALEKYAVRAGGGVNHRFGLSDGVLIKDNHLAVAASITGAVEQARARVGHMMKIEVEIDSLAQLDEALAAGADAIMLDNMTLDDMARAVKRVAGKAVLEASGNVTRERVRAIAETGVDLISSGAITHSAPALDVALDAEGA
jgi:nicotinate-nucleotide pyrophosphorylase (carboxylating)